MAINEGAAFIDHIEDVIKVVLQEWQPVPLTKGHEHWGEAFHQIIRMECDPCSWSKTP